MKTPEAQRRLSDITASQWGMVTARQAENVGVGHLELSRLTKSGHLERLEQGIYRDSGAPTDRLEYLRGAWLSTDPGRVASDRLADRENGIVVSGRSAATVHRIGDLREGAHEFTTPTRRQSKRPDIRYRKRSLPQDAVVIREGLPVTTLEQTILDLINDGEDLSLVAQVVRDASKDRLNGSSVLEQLTASDARRYGAKNVTALWKKILQNARIDDETVAEEVAASPIGPMVAQTYLRELQQSLSKYSSDELRKITDNIVPASTKAAIQNLLLGASDVSRLVSLPVLEMVRAQIAAGANLSSDALRQELTKAASRRQSQTDPPPDTYGTHR